MCVSIPIDPHTNINPPKVKGRAPKMTRKRIRHARMQNESARKSCLKKRSGGLIKKVEELAVLCDVEAAVTIYSPGEPNPEMHPSQEEMKRLLIKYQSTPEVERIKRTTTLESYLKERIEKEEEKLKRLQKKNHEKEMRELMNKLIIDGTDINQLDVRQLSDFSAFAADLLKQVQIRDNELDRQSPALPPPPVVATPPVQAAALDEAGPSQVGGDDAGPSSIPQSMMDLMNDQWFMETMNENQNAGAASTSGTNKDQEQPDEPDNLWP